MKTPHVQEVQKTHEQLVKEYMDALRAELDRLEAEKRDA